MLRSILSNSSLSPSIGSADPVVRLDREAGRDTPAGSRLFRDAAEALAAPVQTVLNKRGTAPSGVRCDYYSVGRYYWPPEGDRSRTPWLHRDGEISPDALAEGDFPAWNRMGQVVETLGLAWFFSGEERYAERALLWLESWFVNEATRMTPHFRYSAAAPGYHDGGGIGLIEAVEPLGLCLNGVALLRSSPLWTPVLERRLHDWLIAFREWMTTHPNALPALRHPNNIGTWSEVLVALISLYLGDEESVRDRSRFLSQRLSEHLEADGSQPRELKRTLSFHYSCYHLEAFLRWAEITERAGVSFWTHETAEGRSLRAGLLFLAEQQPWPFPDLRGANNAHLHELISVYLQHVGDDAVMSQHLGHLSGLKPCKGEALEISESRRVLMGRMFYLF